MEQTTRNQQESLQQAYDVIKPPDRTIDQIDRQPAQVNKIDKRRHTVPVRVDKTKQIERSGSESAKSQAKCSPVPNETMILYLY